MLKDLPLSEHIHQHCNESMERALLAERHPLWARSCPELKDIDFIRLGLLRCISVADSGRHFLQTNEQIYGQLLPHSTYFKSLKSHRRTSMLEAFEQQSYHLHSETLLSQGIDYLKAFPELDEYTIEAADGHFIDHTCHTEKNSNRGVAIFAKACFGHPSPSKQQKLNATTYASGGPDSSSSPRPDPTRGRNIGSK
ncbi:hypothetical protein [Bathymodiolus japonicus methanotrophic gill symbiont]|uniref:hypothetical protein n=1 Tax=Bathymodiolus japonicus methanotrophic gill symbiont TaxID=113269 RepID=UPI001C8DCFB5|nr:hypothetical protein [Bathymodiolus japonicus methanotrophic gill symbiont]